MHSSAPILRLELQEPDAIEMLSGAVRIYLDEIEECRKICDRHNSTAAIHDTDSKALEVYRLFERDAGAAAYLHRITKLLPAWNEADNWKGEGNEWMKVQRNVEARMKRHKKQTPIVTKGVAWEGRPLLIHAYKFDADPTMKVELVLPSEQRHMPDLPLKIIASVLRCHEELIPEGVASARPPFERHETKFLTISDYLERNCPKGLYASTYLPSAPTLTPDSA